MRLTWRDAAAAVFMAAAVGLYVAHLRDAFDWPVSGTRGTAAVILALGMVGGCGLSRANTVSPRDESKAQRVYFVTMTVLGIVALGASITALVVAAESALAVLFAATMALWILATCRHAYGTRADKQARPGTNGLLPRPPAHI